LTNLLTHWVGQDMGLATNVSRESGSAVPLAEAAEKIYTEAVERYPELSTRDFSAVYEYLARA
jgi:3-hydroxyisobutyrate dehydrogenase